MHETYMGSGPGGPGDAMAGQMAQSMPEAMQSGGLMPGIDPNIMQQLMQMQQQRQGPAAPFSPSPSGSGGMQLGDPMRDRIPMEQRLQGKMPPLGQ